MHSREIVLQALASMMRGSKKQKLKSHVGVSTGSKKGKQLKEVKVSAWVRKRRLQCSVLFCKFGMIVLGL